MTARITGTPRPCVAYGNAEVRQLRLDSDRAIGIRDVEGNVNGRAEQRIWGRMRPVRANGNRRIVAVGHTQHWGQHTILCVDSVEDGSVYAETVHVR